VRDFEAKINGERDKKWSGRGRKTLEFLMKEVE
jgi:hypothetical protein